MKKELFIQFQIIQTEDLEKQEDEFELTVFSVFIPEKKEELYEMKEMKLDIFQKKFIPNRAGKIYTFKINQSQLKELINL